MTFCQFIILAVITAVLSVITSISIFYIKWNWENPLVKNIISITHHEDGTTPVRVENLIRAKVFTKDGKMAFKNTRISIKKAIVTEYSDGHEFQYSILEDRAMETIVYTLEINSKIQKRFTIVSQVREAYVI